MPHGALVPALIVGVPLALFLGHRVGDLLPMLVFFALAVFMVFVMPYVPGSPVACLADHHSQCKGHQTWLFGLAFVAPLVAAVIIKTLRGDKRGATGTWGR